MITLIHGENISLARNRFNQIIDSYKKNGFEIINLDKTKDISSQLTSNSLFSEKVVYILQNPKKLGTELKMNSDMVLLCDGNAPVAVTKIIPKDAKIERFDLPKKLFFFLESIVPGNAKNVLQLFHELIDSEPIELVFYMISRQFKDLYWVLEDEKTMTIPTWRLGKLKSQATKFGKEKIVYLIDYLADIDYKSKTGQVDILTSLDLLFARELE